MTTRSPRTPAYPGIRPGIRSPADRPVFDVVPPGAGAGFTLGEIRRIVSLAGAARRTPALVAARRHSGEVRYLESRAIRSATIHELSHREDTAFIFQRVLAIVAESNQRLWGFSLSGIFYPVKVIRYAAGDHYTWHTDLGGGDASDRKLSITVQLSRPDSYRGGELELLAGASPSVAPTTLGATVIFPSYTLHRVAPVVYGTRLALVTWVQGEPFR